MCRGEDTLIDVTKSKRRDDQRGQLRPEHDMGSCCSPIAKGLV